MPKQRSPRASFVIPAYNAERWISKALYSCRNQTIKEIEVVVVDDGSKDYTGEICDWHAKEDPRIRVFHNENKGRSAARNFGNDKVASPLILVLDADDMATKNRVKDTIACFSLKKPDFMFGSFFAMDSMGTATNKMVCSEFDPEISKKSKLNYICHSTVAYTKALSEAVRYEEGEWSKLGLDDWKFQWEAHKKGFKLKALRNPLCYYRVTEDNTMATRDPKAVEAAKEAYLVSV